MTREELKNLIEGITDEQLKAILDINTADIGKAKKNHDEVQKENETLKQDITDLKGKIENLSRDLENAGDAKTKLEELQKKIKEREEQEANEKAEAELTAAIEGVFGEKVFTSEYARAGVIADMKTAILKPENKGKGYSEIFEALTKDKEGIFANANPPGDMKKMGNFDTTKELKDMTYSERAAYFEAHPDAE